MPGFVEPSKKLDAQLVNQVKQNTKKNDNEEVTRLLKIFEEQSQKRHK